MMPRINRASLKTIIGQQLEIIRCLHQEHHCFGTPPPLSSHPQGPFTTAVGPDIISCHIAQSMATQGTVPESSPETFAFSKPNKRRRGRKSSNGSEVPRRRPRRKSPSTLTSSRQNESSRNESTLPSAKSSATLVHTSYSREKAGRASRGRNSRPEAESVESTLPGLSTPRHRSAGEIVLLSGQRRKEKSAMEEPPNTRDLVGKAPPGDGAVEAEKSEHQIEPRGDGAPSQARISKQTPSTPTPRPPAAPQSRASPSSSVDTHDTILATIIVKGKRMMVAACIDRGMQHNLIHRALAYQLSLDIAESTVKVRDAYRTDGIQSVGTTTLCCWDDVDLECLVCENLAMPLVFGRQFADDNKL